jgi:hypothetical protein
MKTSVFDVFASRVLEVYHVDTEAFWSAVMAPFLSNTTVISLIKHKRVGLELMTLFKELDLERKRFLKEYSTSWGSDVNQWKSLLKKEEYFKDAYPIYAFLVIWMDHQNMTHQLSKFGDLLRAVMYGIAGYGILDVIVDEKNFSPVELLCAHQLIAEYETTILNTFGVSKANLFILHHIRNQFLNSEIKEKSCRMIKSPYIKEYPIECGFKAAHLLTPFMLSLEQLNKSHLTDDYFRVFFLFGAVIQIIDDLKDLEDDLSIGHFSYITLDSDALIQFKKGRKPRDIARSLLGDEKRLQDIYHNCSEMIDQAMVMLQTLEDDLLARIVHVTDLRLKAFFRNELNATYAV